MAPSKHGTRFHGIPPAEVMREARDDRRRKHEQALAERKLRQGQGTSPYLSGSIPAISGRSFFAATNIAADPDLGALRLALMNIDAARDLTRRKPGHPTNVKLLLDILTILERTETPLRVYSGAAAVAVVADVFQAQGRSLSRDAIQAALRRLSDLRNMLGLRKPRKHYGSNCSH
jgi:hypothetical protein